MQILDNIKKRSNLENLGQNDIYKQDHSNAESLFEVKLNQIG